MNSRIKDHTKSLVYGFVAAVLMVLAPGSFAAAEPLMTNVGPKATVEEHQAAAVLYRQESEKHESEAAKLEEKAAAISSLQDPKGFVRNGLITAAQEQRRKAGEMKQLYAAHQIQVLTLTGQLPPE